MDHNDKRAAALLQNLARFGLDPKQWSLRSVHGEKRQRVIFENREDTTFKLLGEKDNPWDLKLKELSLLTI